MFRISTILQTVQLIDALCTARGHLAACVIQVQPVWIIYKPQYRLIDQSKHSLECLHGNVGHLLHDCCRPEHFVDEYFAFISSAESCNAAQRYDRFKLACTHRHVVGQVQRSLRNDAALRFVDPCEPLVSNSLALMIPIRSTMRKTQLWLPYFCMTCYISSKAFVISV